MVETALVSRGLRFGTDGSVGALRAYLANAHAPVPLASARAGDVLFFNLARGRDGCTDRGPDHVGLVEAVDGTGRVTFKEVRDGRVHKSLVHPGAPGARRDAQGRMLNSFLRAKQPGDPAGTAYFAGEMICAAYRTEVSTK